jgi:hypothetical protein
MHGTESRRLHGEDPTVREGDQLPLPGAPETERTGAAAGPAVRGEVEDDPGEVDGPPANERDRPLPFLLEEVEDGYGALFLSRS